MLLSQFSHLSNLRVGDPLDWGSRVGHVVILLDCGRSIIFLSVQGSSVGDDILGVNLYPSLYSGYASD
jgi:hypothetical protein